MNTEQPTPELHRLLHIIERLRAPGGCPWDREQSEESMAPHLLEEAFEAVEAIQTTDVQDSCEELGDVLMNVLMIAQIASEAGRFDSEDVARTISDKLVRRHPHVFGDVTAADSEEVLQNWEQIKKSEKGGQARGALDGVPASLPALQLAYRIGEKAHRTGFDWPDAAGPRSKLDEELGELDEALASENQAAIEAELGDVLFSLVNVARHAGINPEMALRNTSRRFKSRFRLVEEALGDRLPESTLAEKEAAWETAKQRLES
ncbi:MAG: nucleoside triphosphate pyrophosphohydrolase [Planctomycetota bacterium]|nr:nucleoside triphosphate pyrophosphohydrolase [Planctomycetota bacterium]